MDARRLKGRSRRTRPGRRSGCRGLGAKGSRQGRMLCPAIEVRLCNYWPYFMMNGKKLGNKCINASAMKGMEHVINH